MLKNHNINLSIDKYAITVAFSLFKQNKHKDQAVAELFYRKPCTSEFPFIVLAGIHYVVEFLNNVKITEEDINFIRQALPNISDLQFFDYLRSFSIKCFEIYAIAEGNFVYGNIPLIKLKGDIALLLLFEAPMLSIMNLCSSASTAAFLLFYHAGKVPIVEMGLRRSFGIEAGYGCSLYGAMSGFKSSSNLIIGKDFGLPTVGTMSHSFILAFDKEDTFDDINFTEGFLKQIQITHSQFLLELFTKRKLFGFENTNNKELKAFLSYAQAFPDNFTALLDTFNTYESGIKNYALVASFLRNIEGCNLGVRIDSGNLINESIRMREFLKEFDVKFNCDLSQRTKIIATNDVNVAFLKEMKQTKHEIDIIGIGTNFATFKDLKPIGFVYKIAEINGLARFKVASGLEKATLPFDKDVYRALTDQNELCIVILTSSQKLDKGKFKGYFLSEEEGKFVSNNLFFTSVEKILNKITNIGEPLNIKGYQENFIFCLDNLEMRKIYAKYIVYSPQIIEPLIEELKLLK